MMLMRSLAHIYWLFLAAMPLLVSCSNLNMDATSQLAWLGWLVAFLLLVIMLISRRIRKRRGVKKTGKRSTTEQVDDEVSSIFKEEKKHIAELKELLKDINDLEKF